MRVYSNFNWESSLDAELNSTSNEYPLGILFTISFFSVFLVFGVMGSVKSMSSGYSLEE